MKRIIFTLLFLLLTPFSANAEEQPQAMIVFDASGSMWGKINGEAKIGIAKQALNKVLLDWNEDLHLGLMAYGHRKKGDCSDIQTLVPIGELNKKAMISKVKAIKPKGKTPISLSLKKAAEELRYTEEKATIILISDGKETCDADPCATAKALKGEGIDFITHVIGFDVDTQTGQQLKCIADSTGGEYFSAKNATSLNDAMGKIAEKVKKTDPKPPVVKKLKKNLEISASEKEGGKWIKAYHNVYKIVDGEAEGNRTTGCYSKKKESCLEKLLVGKYTLHSTYNDFKQETNFEVKAGEATKLHIVMGQTGKIEVTASEKEGGKWIEAYHYTYKIIDGEIEGNKTTGCYSKKKNSCIEQIPVGKYILRSTYNDFKQETNFEIKASETTKLHIVMGQTGKIEITASEKEGGKWIKAYHYVYKIVDGEAEGNKTTGCYSKRKNSCVEQIPVGKYILRSTYNEFKQDTSFEIKASEVTKLNIVFGQTGKVEVISSEKEGGKWIDASNYIYIPNEEGKAGERVGSAHSKKKRAGVDKLPVGKYVLVSSYNEFKKETQFEIKAGEVTKLSIIFSQFIIKTKCADMQATINHEIYASTGKLVFEKKTSCSKPVNAVLESGSYTLTTMMGSQSKDTKFSVGTDHPSQITIDMQNINKEPSHQDLIDADKKEQSSTKTKEDATPQQEPQVKRIPIDNDKLTKGLADLGKQMEMMSKQNPSITDRKIIDENGNVDLPSVDEVQGAMRQAGALLNGLLSLGKGLEKEPLQGMKEAMRASLPKYQASVECYQNADDLDGVKQCEVIEKELVELAQEKFQLVTGFKTDKVIQIKPHTEWNDEIKKQTVAKKQSELKEIKLTVQCFDQGAGFLEVQDCIKNNGKYTEKKSEFEQLGNFLNAFGGMAK